jgi:transcriptional regulator with XRE-family HTH domain
MVVHQRMAIPRVREYRKSASLAQRELAMLVGLATQHAFSELESGAKRPGLDVAFACALALGVPLDNLFPELATHIEQAMLLRARALLGALQADDRRRQPAVYVANLVRRLSDHLAS